MIGYSNRISGVHAFLCSIIPCATISAIVPTPYFSNTKVLAATFVFQSVRTHLEKCNTWKDTPSDVDKVIFIFGSLLWLALHARQVMFPNQTPTNTQRRPKGFFLALLDFLSQSTANNYMLSSVTMSIGVYKRDDDMMDQSAYAMAISSMMWVMMKMILRLSEYYFGYTEVPESKQADTRSKAVEEQDTTTTATQTTATAFKEHIE